MKEIKADLIELAKLGHFDIIGHGCNCFCKMGSGIAPQIAKAFLGVREADNATILGDIKKLGNYTIAFTKSDVETDLMVLNIYSQYTYYVDQKPFDYEAFTIALRKINHEYPNKKIGLPLIGAGLAGGNWDRIKAIIETELKSMNVTIVHYNK